MICLFLRWMGRICKNDFASPLQPSEHTHVSQLFEKRKVGFLHAYGWAAVLGWTSNGGGWAGCPGVNAPSMKLRPKIRCRLHARATVKTNTRKKESAIGIIAPKRVL